MAASRLGVSMCWLGFAPCTATPFDSPFTSIGVRK
jgi:hypothetical protein